MSDVKSITLLRPEENMGEMCGRVDKGFSLWESIDDEIKNWQIGFNLKTFKCSLKETVFKKLSC